MKVVVITLLLAAVALSATEAGTFIAAYPEPQEPLFHVAAVPKYLVPGPVRLPSQDHAVVHSERVGGNFAYSTAERHAYSVPVVHHHVISPVVKYSPSPVLAPVPVAYVPAAPVY